MKTANTAPVAAHLDHPVDTLAYALPETGQPISGITWSGDDWAPTAEDAAEHSGWALGIEGYLIAASPELPVDERRALERGNVAGFQEYEARGKLAVDIAHSELVEGAGVKFALNFGAENR